MEPRTPESVTLSTSESLAQFLDANCHRWNLHRSSSNLLQQLDDAIYPDDIKDSVALERIALGFGFDGTTAKREWSASTDAGEEVGSVQISQFQPAAFGYFAQRFNQTTNPYLKARYGLILWNGPRPYKNQQTVQAAIDQLLVALPQADCTNRHGIAECCGILRELCSLATTIRYREADVSAAVLQRFTNSIPFELAGRTGLLRVITEYHRLFRPFVTNVLATTRLLFEENITAAEFFACEQMADLAASFAQGSQLDVQEWHFRRGRAYEGLALHRLTDDSSLMSMQFYTQAASAYQLAGDGAAEQTALEKAQALKPQLRLSTISTPLSAEHTKMLVDDINQKTAYVLSFQSNEVLELLARNEWSIPDYLEVRTRITQEPPSVLESIASTVYIDSNNNFQYGARGEEEALNQRVSQAYSSAISFKLQYLIPIFLEGYREGKITFDSCQQYFESHSWIARPLDEQDISGNHIEYSWKAMLYPGLREFFEQLDKFINEGPESASFVLCLDSLTVKIEGMLREVLQRMGAATIATHRNNNLREVFFDDLLNLALVNGLLNESECYFFRYLFTPLGNNLRNDIAHCYYHLGQDYSLQKIILLLIALLRISSFQLSPASAAEGQVNAPE